MAPGPTPASRAVSDRMARTGQRDTAAELRVRSELHSRGLRFRVDRAPISGVRRRADVVFTRRRVAVFIDGCFWHGCPDHGTWPKHNADWWREKINANVRRDRDTNSRLEEAGWTVVRIWEHEDPVDAADRVERALGAAGP
jgi:DNA mismatch endonuclease, patch repair protein